MDIQDIVDIAQKHGFELSMPNLKTEMPQNKKIFRLFNEQINQHVYLYRKHKGGAEINLERVRIHPIFSPEDVAPLNDVKVTKPIKGDRYIRKGGAMTAFPKQTIDGITEHCGLQVTVHSLNGFACLFEFLSGGNNKIEQELLVQIANIENASTLSETEKEALIKIRLGQSIFKKRVAGIEKACRVTGVDDTRFLIASHILPWSKCETDAQRLDGHNGLLLSPHIDKLFDNGYISFSDDGRILIADHCSRDVLEKWTIDFEQNVKPLTHQQAHYMMHHRKQFGFE